MKHKLLYIYFEPQESGQTRHVLSLVQGLKGERFDPTVVLPTDLLTARRALEGAGAQVVPLAMGKILWNPGTISKFISLIRTGDFQIVHVHSQEAGFLARLLTRSVSTAKIIYTPQCTNIRRRGLFWLYRSAELLWSKITDRIISVSEVDRRQLLDWGIPASRLVTIHNGLDPGVAPAQPGTDSLRKQLHLNEEQPIVMQVARLSEQKNPLAFIRGAALVIKELPAAQFLLVGDGPLRIEVERCIQELGIQANVHCLGRRAGAAALMAEADIITLTSRWEGLPYVLLEAMACSRPVVTTAVNGCSEVVEQGVSGYLVPENDEQSWSRSVIELLMDQRKASRMGESGYHRLREKFSLEHMLEQTEQVYDDLTANDNSR